MPYSTRLKGRVDDRREDGGGVQFFIPGEPWRKGPSRAGRKDKVRPQKGLPSKIVGCASMLRRPFLDSMREGSASWRC